MNAEPITPIALVLSPPKRQRRGSSLSKEPLSSVPHRTDTLCQSDPSLTCTPLLSLTGSINLRYLTVSPRYFTICNCSRANLCSLSRHTGPPHWSKSRSSFSLPWHGCQIAALCGSSRLPGLLLRTDWAYFRASCEQLLTFPPTS